MQLIVITEDLNFFSDWPGAILGELSFLRVGGERERSAAESPRMIHGPGDRAAHPRPLGTLQAGWTHAGMAREPLTLCHTYSTHKFNIQDIEYPPVDSEDS